MEKRQLIAALVEKTGIKLTEDDPAFLLVDLNLLMLEHGTGEAAKRLADATAQFNAVTTRNVDDFVGVANEALSKFMQRTKEMSATLDRIHGALAAAGTMPAHTVIAPAPVEKKEPPANMLWWLVPLVFGLGIVAGVVLSLAIAK